MKAPRLFFSPHMNDPDMTALHANASLRDTLTGRCWPGLCLLLCFAAMPAVLIAEEKNSPGEQLFTEQVAPILTAKCLACHRDGKSESGFSLSSREALLDSGMVEPEAADESWLVNLIRHTDEPHMPLEGEKLDDDQIEAIVRWINLGAPYTKPLQYDDPNVHHWAFQRLEPISPPAVEEEWVTNEIDRFIRAAQQQKGLAPSEIADRRTLVRRLYFDLIGLPPSEAEIESFLADERPDAYEHLVDRLLESPRYGENWGRHWLDVARYADSNGYRFDDEQKAAYHYRDFVIKALNDDMPYDQFVRWQLAGDELAPDNVDALTATGFLAVGPRERDEGTPLNRLMVRHDELDDLIATTSSGMLGLTLSCARCHDHKFDSLSQREYFQFFHIFNSGKRREIDLERPVAAGTTGDAPKHQKALVYSEEADRPQPTHLLLRGIPDAKGPEVSLGFIDLLTNERDPEAWFPTQRPTKKTSYQRAALAHWITDPDYGGGHLLARVMVNRLWYHHFGEGLVRTPNDFGVQGDRPELPELLDWLALDLMRHGWRLKPLHRQMVLSSTYRQATQPLQSTQLDADRAHLDPENRTWWRRKPIRLTAEQLRDSMLVVSGTLNDTMYGPGVKVPIPREVIITRSQEAYPPNIKDNRDVWRRSVYVFAKRTTPVPLIQMFDGADTSISCGQRVRTTVPTQSLILMNNDFVRARSQNFAAQATERARETGQTAWEVAFTTALGRSPNETEKAKLRDFIARQTELRGADEGEVSVEVLTDLCQVLFSSNEFVYVE